MNRVLGYYVRVLNKRAFGLCSVFSFLLSLSFFLGKAEGLGIRWAFLYGVAFFVPILLAVLSLVCFVGGVSKRLISQEMVSTYFKKHFLFAFVIMVVLWLGVLLVYYPGVCTVDSNDVLKMVLGREFYASHFKYTALNNHHPIAYTFFVSLIVKPCIRLGLSVTKTIAVVAFVQLILFAASVVYMCKVIFQQTMNARLTGLIYLFFLFNPLVSKMAITLWKDIPFTAVALFFFSFVVQENSAVAANKTERTKRTIIVVLLSVLIAMLRNGGIIIPISLFVTSFALRMGERKRIVARGLMLLAVYFFIKGSAFSAAGIQPGHFAEAVATPLQQLSRVVTYDGKLNEEEKEFLDRLLPLEDYAKNYNSETVNRIKFAKRFSDDFLEANKGKFIKVWVSVGTKNVKTYILAWIEETKGFWSRSIETDYHISPAEYDLGDGAIVENVLPSSFRASAEQVVRIYSRSTDFLVNCASLGWLMAFALLLSIVLKKRKAIIVSTPCVILWLLFVMNTPYFQQFRYLYPIYMTLPLVFVLILFDDENNRTSIKEG